MLAALHELSGTQPEVPEISAAGPEPSVQAAIASEKPSPTDETATQDGTDSEEGSAPIAPSSEGEASGDSRREGSDVGTETEEDEGMVLVGRPGP